MSAFSLLLNVLWIVFGGLEMAIAWFIAAIIMAITIVGLPWARAAFNIGVYTLLPFGQSRGLNTSARTTQAPGCWDLLAISFGWCWPAGGWR